MRPVCIEDYVRVSNEMGGVHTFCIERPRQENVESPSQQGDSDE